jgi:peptidyl-prolyl cis-trans isomerase SurA
MMMSANPAFRRLLAAMAIAIGAALFCSGGAIAQNVLAYVNRQPITNFDVAQRIRIAALTERRRLDSRAALQELIDDQVKIIEARRIGYRITEDGVEQEFGRLARGNNQTPAQFNEALRRGGIEPSALRERIRVNLAWQVLLRDQARRGQQVSSEEIDKAIAERDKKQREIVDYELQSVIFVVGTGQSPGERERAANAARSRFSGCGEGMESFRQLKDVAVRPVTVRSTETMSPALVNVLSKTPVGRLTQPYRTEQGIEMVAVCARKQREGGGALRGDVAAELAEKKINENTRAYLTELRKKVDIQMAR